uniref:Uncharacterized protein isoform X1 n=1 Tax=Nicotiana tabacum TaxID=4097 RepID=A0A1S3Y324_TOBAC|nr:PREDICTED: uncharacterized protein LOC107771615 isoform X1 [Nicotiana tabacum]
MPFPEKWNMKPVAWMPGAIPNLKSWVRNLASTSSYAERSWRDLSKGRWEVKTHGLGKVVVMRPLSGEEETSIPAPKSAKDKKRKKTSPFEDPEPKNPDRRVCSASKGGGGRRGRRRLQAGGPSRNEHRGPKGH